MKWPLVLDGGDECEYIIVGEPMEMYDSSEEDEQVEEDEVKVRYMSEDAMTQPVTNIGDPYDKKYFDDIERELDEIHIRLLAKEKERQEVEDKRSDADMLQLMSVTQTQTVQDDKPVITG